MTPDEIRSIVRDELASLGGHLLSVYGDTPLQVGIRLENEAGDVKTDARTTHPLATLGGYLLEYYSNKATIAYRDPEPPAIGEPPTTTPAPDTEPGT